MYKFIICACIELECTNYLCCKPTECQVNGVCVIYLFCLLTLVSLNFVLFCAVMWTQSLSSSQTLSLHIQQSKRPCQQFN